MADHRWDTSPSVPQLSPTSETPGSTARRHRRRWFLSFRAAVLAVCLLLGAAAALMVAKGGGPAAEITSVELSTDGRVPAAEEQPGRKENAGGAEADDSGTGSRDQNQNQGQALVQSQAQEGAGRKSGAPPGQAAEPSVLVIHVAGAVAQPGVVRIPSGSRTGEAVDAAGGAASDADLTAVNLAAPLQDGMMVIVPRIGDEPRAVPGGNGADGAGTGSGAGLTTGTGAGSASGSGTGKGTGTAAGAGTAAPVNINAATVQELDALPRIGPVLAERIIAWRTDHGRFTRPEDLDAVPGIGETMLAALLPLITV